MEGRVSDDGWGVLETSYTGPPGPGLGAPPASWAARIYIDSFLGPCRHGHHSGSTSPSLVYSSNQPLAHYLPAPAATNSRAKALPSSPLAILHETFGHEQFRGRLSLIANHGHLFLFRTLEAVCTSSSRRIFHRKPGHCPSVRAGEFASCRTWFPLSLQCS